jgi:hypothetical protein
MHDKNTLSLHARIALEIKAAKKTMFKRHREGQSMPNAANSFLWELQNRLHKALVETGQQPPERPTRLANRVPPVHVPIAGTVGADGIKLFDDVVDEAKLDERDRVQGEVNAILTWFDSPTPDFISDAVMDAITRACEHFGIEEPEYEVGYQGQTCDVLTQLFAKTKMFKLDDIENSLGDLSWAISHILNSSAAPARLRQSVGEFVTDISTPLLDDSQEIIEKALGFGQCGYGLCPGSDDPLNPCPGPDAHEKEERTDHVTATLPNGKEVELYGDAVDLAKEPVADQKVIRALSELLHNPETPQGLFVAISEFVTDQSNEAGPENLYHSDVGLSHVLDSVPAEERRAATLERRNAE